MLQMFALRMARIHEQGAGSTECGTPVLVDGVRIGSATSGLASFQDLPVAMIDRIEIVRGPGAADRVIALEKIPAFLK